MNEAGAKAHASEPEQATALHACGIEHVERGEYSFAAELFGRAAALRPGVPALHIDLAEAFRNLGDGMRAAGCCRIALKLRPDDPEALNTLGPGSPGNGPARRGGRTFRRAVELQPDSVAVHNNLGVVFRELGRTEEAIAEFRQAVALDPGLFRVHTNLGMALLRPRPGRRSSAASAGGGPPATGDGDPAPQPRRALRRLGRDGEAGAAEREALRLDPDLAIPPPPHGRTWSTPRAARRSGPGPSITPWATRCRRRGGTSMRGPPTSRRSGSTPGGRRPTSTSGSP